MDDNYYEFSTNMVKTSVIDSPGFGPQRENFWMNYAKLIEEGF